MLLTVTGLDINKKARPIARRAFEYVVKILLSRDLTYLSVIFTITGGVGTLRSVEFHSEQVVKASSGHIPQPFLIRDV